MSMSDVYRCTSCGYEVADINYATMDDDDCPACGGVPVVQFTLVKAELRRAEKRKEVKA